MVFTGEMNNNIIVGLQENNNKYLNLLSKSGFFFFINVYTRLPKGQNHDCLEV